MSVIHKGIFWAVTAILLLVIYVILLVMLASYNIWLVVGLLAIKMAASYIHKRVNYYKNLHGVALATWDMLDMIDETFGKEGE